MYVPQLEMIDGKRLLSLDTPVDQTLSQQYLSIWGHGVSGDSRASLIVWHSASNILNMQGLALVDTIRSFLQREEGHTVRHLADPVTGTEDVLCNTVRIWEFAEVSVWHDYMQKTARAFPIAMVFVCLLAIPLLTCYFGGALVASVKITLTAILPLSWVYGSAVICYEDGLFDFLGDSPLHSTGGLHWLVPCISCPVLLSLALDFNLFFFGRVHEFRQLGLGDLDAIRQGLAATGPMITRAGMIFGLECSGLILSSSGVSRQVGFCIVVGVVIDTFIVRSTIVPALLSIGPACNWWPSDMLISDHCEEMQSTSSSGEEEVGDITPSK